MKASSGTYRPALDQLRGIAAYLVFCWHFIHTDQIVPFNADQLTFWPLSIVNMGYVGVSLFMVLSGYLFAALTWQRDVIWSRFAANRALRLLPLLTVAVLGAYAKARWQGIDLELGRTLLLGLVFPVLPQSAWSVTVECHFYLLLPVLLWIGRRSEWAWVGLVAAAVAARLLMFADGVVGGEFAYYTVISRIDQFLLGMFAWCHRDALKGRHVWAGGATLLFMGFMRYLDQPPSPSDPYRGQDVMWATISTIEGVYFALIVSWWDTNRPDVSPSAMGRLLIRMGQCSYSMYLLHFFWVYMSARWLHQHVWPMSSPEVGAAMATLVYLLSLPITMLSYRLIEAPFLQIRRPYVRPPLGHLVPAPSPAAAAGGRVRDAA